MQLVPRFSGLQEEAVRLSLLSPRLSQPPEETIAPVLSHLLWLELVQRRRLLQSVPVHRPSPLCWLDSRMLHLYPALLPRAGIC
jgi:hypothetical protein